LKITNQNKKKEEERPLQMASRQEIKKKEPAAKLLKVRSAKKIETLAKSSSKQSLLEKIEAKKTDLALSTIRGATDDVKSDCQTPK
jgi:hypothetical protein